ncbi:MAG: RNB domain-containing ribonuclease [Clostridia bacterium]|nr:RNB domain-containing ribonuclease [Clostridia bacterium]
MAFSDVHVEKVKKSLLSKMIDNHVLPEEKTIYTIAKELNISRSKVRKVINGKLSSLIAFSDGTLELTKDGQNLVTKLYNKFAKKENSQLGQSKKIEIYGRIEKNKNSYVFVPNDKKHYGEYLIIGEDIAKEHLGHYVRCSTYEGIDSSTTVGYITEVVEDLGSSESYKATQHSIISEYNLDYKYDEATKKQAEEIPAGSKQEILEYIHKINGDEWFSKFMSKLQDKTELPICSMDPKGAFNVDDAFYVEKIGENRYRYYVAISEIAAFMRPDSPLVKTAIQYSSDAYLTGKCFSMFPYEIAEKLSIYEGKERLVSLKEFEIDCTTGYPEIVDVKEYPAFVKSRHALTYAEGNDIYYNKNGAREKFADVAQSVINACEGGEIISELLKFSGALDLESSEFNMILSNDHEHVDEIINDNGTVAHVAVEIAMKSYAKCFATKAKEKNLKAIYRVLKSLTEKQEEKIESLMSSFEFEGFDKEDVQGSINALIDYARDKDYAKIDEMSKDPERYPFYYLNLMPTAEIYSRLMIMSGNKAKYSPLPLPHSALNEDIYAQITSAIRRVIDLINQYVDSDAILNTNVAECFAKTLNELCEHFNTREDIITTAERLDYQASGVLWARDNVINKILSCRIMNLDEKNITFLWGSFEIKVPVDQLSNNGSFVLLKDGLALVNKKTKEVYSVGQECKVLVQDTNMSTKTITGKIINGKTVKQEDDYYTEVDKKILGIG